MERGKSKEGTAIHREFIYDDVVHPLQRLFKENQNFLIRQRGSSYAETVKNLLIYSGISLSRVALAHYKSKGSNNMYYFCSVAYLLNINVLDLFRPDFIEQYLAGNIKDVIYPQPEPIDTIQK